VLSNTLNSSSVSHRSARKLGRRFNSLIGTLLIISGAFGAFWKRNVISVGEYDCDTITEDFDITLKMRKLGKQLRFAEKAVSWTFAPENWKDWRRQRICWTKGQLQSLWRHRNLFRKEAFPTRLVWAVYDMFFMDVVLLLARFAWIMMLLFLYNSILPYILFLSFLLYLGIELLMVLTARLLSRRREDLKKCYLVPIIVVFYRPYYGLVRLKAYLEWALNAKDQW